MSSGRLVIERPIVSRQSLMSSWSSRRASRRSASISRASSGEWEVGNRLGRRDDPGAICLRCTGSQHSNRRFDQLVPPVRGTLGDDVLAEKVHIAAGALHVHGNYAGICGLQTVADHPRHVAAHVPGVQSVVTVGMAP